MRMERKPRLMTSPGHQEDVNVKSWSHTTTSTFHRSNFQVTRLIWGHAQLLQHITCLSFSRESWYTLESRVYQLIFTEHPVARGWAVSVKGSNTGGTTQHPNPQQRGPVSCRTFEYMAPLSTRPLRIQMMDAAGLATSAWHVRLRGSPARKLTTGAPTITGSSGGTVEGQLHVTSWYCTRWKTNTKTFTCQQVHTRGAH